MPANPKRGEVEIEYDGQLRLCRLSGHACEQFQEMTGKDALGTAYNALMIFSRVAADLVAQGIDVDSPQAVLIIMQRLNLAGFETVLMMKLWYVMLQKSLPDLAYDEFMDTVSPADLLEFFFPKLPDIIGRNAPAKAADPGNRQARRQAAKRRG